MADTPRHSVSVAGIVVNDSGRVLVIRRRDNDRWEPPGGVLEMAETFEEGVRREVLEETGMSVQVQRLTGVYKNMQRGIVALVYRCTPLNEPASASAEAVEVRWMTLDEVREAMSPAYAVRVTDAFEPELHTRAHDGVNLLP
ncbi:ADP-ribose pyrophosphatase YjhB (NUDIX family) [Saccharothrix saharensis]|uniref:ADP-ribose pyrophosphatase YjhB (NUDIX family) n=1 Tax=Saccharothrix saharensis TaxID=571190 RepID=A0A543JJ98_9PSEU|nr:NUDIX domain-containing protein [Saccharothrix saharensis]TQM82895.1 ADP-ribose pyrophosphatase YjhB (NUDIX family) [Saccharothrix saharensis]